MRNADTVLAIIHERGERGLPLERIHRLLYNKDLYLRAYAKLYPNKGAMTPGTTGETVDGMSLKKIDQLIDDLRQRRFRWTPVRRVYIPKTNGKQRPLGVTSWRDKLVQEVIRSILEAFYEPQFSDHSHGFRPGRGCHTALQKIQITWSGTRWLIEGDLAQYFDTINHEVLINILGEKLHDARFLQLIRELLKAGYLEDWKYNQTLSGTPQGGVISPILSNIYLDRFDKYVEQVLIPTWTRGKQRRHNPAYRKVAYLIEKAKQKGQKTEVKALYQQLRQLPTFDLNDMNYRRLRYVRYADDWLVGFVGTRAEAETIKQDIKAWLDTQLKLTLSNEKTLITQATTGTARFLGYNIVNQQANDKITARIRAINGVIGLRVPREVIAAACKRYMRKGKVIHRSELMNDSDFAIITRYQQEYRGLVQYYIFAIDIHVFNKLHWIMEQSLLQTLAAKHKTTVSTMRTKYRTQVKTPAGKSLQCLEVRVERKDKTPLLARFGGIELTRRTQAILEETPPIHKNQRTELLKRLMADECELCGSRENIEVHHIRKLADLNRKDGRATPQWVKRMAAMRRKTLIVCHSCHQKIHRGQLSLSTQPQVI